jgi:XTP/dITP diphosphohydrolase
VSAPLSGGRLVIASHNPGKVREIADLLAPYGVTVLSAAELDLPEPEETGSSFAENAAIKAKAAAAGAGLPALADDSGLVVAALGGEPGIHSARWAGPERDFGRAMERVERELAERGAETGGAQRGAAFVCALCLARPDGRTETFEGRVDGHLAWPPRGTRGFGYDPIFVPDGHDVTFGEMEPAEKHAISHRARAFAKLVAALFEADRIRERAGP